MQFAQAAVVFSEDFGTLANGTNITTGNTDLTYVRVGTQGGSITALSPSTVGSGSSLLMTGPSGGSLNGIGVGSGLDFGGQQIITMEFDFSFSTTTGTVVWGLGSGDRFTGNNTFSTNQGLVWFQVTGTTLQRRTSSAWTDVATGLAIDEPYSFLVSIDNASNLMHVFLNGSPVASGVAVTTENLVPDGFRIYSVTGRDVEIDNILLTASPEPSTALLFGLGLLTLLRRRRRG